MKKRVWVYSAGLCCGLLLAMDEAGAQVPDAPREPEASDPWAGTEFADNPPEPEPPPTVEPIDARFEASLRSGLGLPLGKVRELGSVEVDSLISQQIPVWLTLGARINEKFLIGLYGSYGFGILPSDVADACDEAERSIPGAEVSCSAYDARFGVRFGYHARTSPTIDPWVSYGLGMEVLGFRQSAAVGGESAELSLSVSGFEYMMLEFGVDFALSKALWIGPIVAVSSGTFSSLSAECDGDCGGIAEVSESIRDTASHQWVFFGVNFTVLP